MFIPKTTGRILNDSRTIDVTRLNIPKITVSKFPKKKKGFTTLILRIYIYIYFNSNFQTDFDQEFFFFFFLI